MGPSAAWLREASAPSSVALEAGVALRAVLTSPASAAATCGLLAGAREPAGCRP